MTSSTSDTGRSSTETTPTPNDAADSHLRWPRKRQVGVATSAVLVLGSNLTLLSS